MDAVFKKRKQDSVICFICGIFLIGLFTLIEFDGNELAGYGVGIAICMGSAVSYLFNLGAYFSVEDGMIRGKYHFFGKINCPLSEIEFVMAQVNTLVLVEKTGRIHTIMGIENSWVLCSQIRRNMTFQATAVPPMLLEELKNLKSAKKKNLIHVCSGVAFMFLYIFVAVYLTGGRDPSAFSNQDWSIMAVMAGVELLTVAVTFYFAHKAGKCRIPIEKLQYTIRRTVMESSPILPGNVLKILTDDHYVRRITVYEYPNCSEAYFCVQEFQQDYSLVQVYESKALEDVQSFLEELSDFIDITQTVLHKVS